MLDWYYVDSLEGLGGFVVAIVVIILATGIAFAID